jgi:hypothetical protein
MNKNIPDNFDFFSEATFIIDIKGQLNEELSDYLCGLKIRHFTTQENIELTRLEGVLADQGALIGVLTTLYEMRFPIVNLKIAEESYNLH